MASARASRASGLVERRPQFLALGQEQGGIQPGQDLPRRDRRAFHDAHLAQQTGAFEAQAAAPVGFDLTGEDPSQGVTLGPFDRLRRHRQRRGSGRWRSRRRGSLDRDQAGDG